MTINPLPERSPAPAVGSGGATQERREPRTIGVVGGLGPYAGLDLVRKVFAATPARRDRDHLPLALLSMPHRVSDRTAFLLGQTPENPGNAIADAVRRLVACGAEVVGVPCNTAHAPPIFQVVERRVAGRCELVNMVEEVGQVVTRRYEGVRRVGVLSTTGTLVAGVYAHCLEAIGVDPVQLPLALQERYVQPAIYDAGFGIKAVSDPVHDRATEYLHIAFEALVRRGAEVVILACTEIPLALRESRGVPLLDATDALARALVRQSMMAPRA